MFKDLLKKAQDIATPERIAALKNSALKAAAMATATAETAAGKIERVIEDRAATKRQEAIGTEKAQAAGKGLSAEARMVLQRHAERQAAHETDTRIRGAGLIDLTSAASQKLLRDKTPELAITIGGVPIDANDEQQHILLAGAPGTGKSVEIKKALRTIRARGQRCVCYDPSGEFTSMFYRPDRDILLNPLDERCAKWDLWADAESYEYAAVAASFIPEAKGNSDPFWVESARAVFESLLTKCRSIDEVVYTGLSSPIKELARLVHETGFGGVVGPETTFMSTRATLATYLRSLATLENVQRGDPNAFSFRQWAENDQDRWIFLTVPAKARDAIRPLASLFLDTAVRHIMSLRPDPARRIWLEIDELPSLQSIPSLSPALAEGRKYGIGAILGVQSFHQLKKSFGDDLAQALWGLPKTRIYLRISDAETADMISRELGEVQLKRKTKSSSESSSVSSGNQGGSSSESSSTSENEQITQERIVLPAEIMGLPDLTGYLRTGGSHRVAKIKVSFDGLARFGDQPDFVWRQQRPLPTAESIKAAPTGQPTKQEQQTMTQEAVTTVTEPTATKATDDAAIEEAIRSRALALMQESMAAWSDADVAALSKDEMSELTSIFVERAAIEITGVVPDVSAS